MISTDEILQLLEELRKQRHPWVRAAEQVLSVYEGQVVLPLAEIDKVDTPAVANLTFQGVDGAGQAIASQMFLNRFLPQTDNELGRKKAHQKRGAVDYWQHESLLEMEMGTLARWFVAYGSTSVAVRPQMKRECPEYVKLDPLTTFLAGDEVCADVAITVRRKTRRWVGRTYPDRAGMLWGRDAKPSDIIEVIDYVDDMEFVTLGRITHDVANPYAARNTEAVVLNRAENIAGRCTVYQAGRPGLAGPKSQFAGVLGMFIQRAVLGAYNMIAVRRGAMPERWAVSSDPSITPEIIEMADPVRGIPGVVAGGQIIQLLPQVSQAVPMTQDRLERDERVQARLPAEWGGESPSNVRTARRGSSVLGSTIDLPILEAHQRLAAMFEAANKGAIAIDKAFWGGKPKTFYLSVGAAEEKVSYDPDALWDNDRHLVIYGAPGMDSAGQTVENGQRVGMQVMSKREFMEQDPNNRDPERTHDLIQAEALEMALLAGIEAQVQQGALPVGDLARIMERVVTDRAELAKAVLDQQQEAQNRQAQQVPATAPEAQPGLAQPGMGAEAGQPPILPPPEGLGNAAHLLRALHAGR